MCGGRVAVVGGSVAGCAAALALHRGGTDEVVVLERAPGRPAERGVGLAVHDDRYDELESAGYLDARMPWIQLERRRWYVRDTRGPAVGRRIGEMPFPFRTYNWGPLWHELRARVPDAVEFRTGTTVGALQHGPDAVELHTTDREGRRRREPFDLAVGADGYRSLIRTEVCSEVCAEPVAALRPEFAGYLAWRGAFPASRMTASDQRLWDVEECAYVVFPGGHVIIYRIPDSAGGHRVNWVLYTAPPPDLDLSLETPVSLPPGTLTDALHTHLARIAAELLPPYWGALVALTEPGELFVQPLYDFTAPRYATGRLLLTGDAATVARPHTGAGAVKALQDATALESALRSASDWAEALHTYDSERIAVGRATVELGRRPGHALVETTPERGSMNPSALDVWWQRAAVGGGLGGRALHA
ncbi:FAD-dependent monooxygenase [Streptomyces sp. NPDC005181]|uniref:FAD-dependent monooxygenase n=1 Tax=Streptomyces sp. NPDC005181 TaxID=3156869 RepID=UPI00339EF526